MFPRRLSLLEIHMSCRLVSSSVSLEDVAVLAECCPSRRDSSLKLLDLVFVSDGVTLSQLDVANIRDLGFVDIYIGISFSIIIFVFDLCIFRPLIFTFIS